MCKTIRRRGVKYTRLALRANQKDTRATGVQEVGIAVVSYTRLPCPEPFARSPQCLVGV